MTEEELEKERAKKQDVTMWLANAGIDDYNLSQIDDRLNHYVHLVAENPLGHNVYEQLAVKRFLQFLDQYEFRIDEVLKFYTFYESLKFEGVRGLQRYKLTPVQTFIFANIYGFYDKDGHRLIREVVIFIPRKFSKTTQTAAMVLYDFLYGDANAQAYIAANSKEQAKICYKAVKNSIKDLNTQNRIKVKENDISWRNDQRLSSIKVLPAMPKKLDGLNASLAVLDEYSQAVSADLREVLETSMAMRENPLTVIITTASDNPDGPFATDLKAYYRTLSGEEDNDSLFAILFQPDVDDVDESSPELWAKVQPHLGITAKVRFYEQQWSKAQRSADNMKNFRTKLLNIFETATGKSWITGKEISSCYRTLDITKLKQIPVCYVGVDLSVDNDFSAVSYYIYLQDEHKGHVITDFYFPEGRLKRHPNREIYKRWAEKGYLKLCKGNIIDYDQIVNDILAHGRYMNIRKIAYDPNKAKEFQNIIKATGGEPYLYPYKQTNYYFTIPVQAIPRMMEQHVLTYDKNPITAYCFDNAVLYIDGMGNAKPMKKSENGNTKIDACITVAMAISVSMEDRRVA